MPTLYQINNATDIAVGSSAASAAYLGSENVWEDYDLPEGATIHLEGSGARQPFEVYEYEMRRYEADIEGQADAMLTTLRQRFSYDWTNQGISLAVTVQRKRTTDSSFSDLATVTPIVRFTGQGAYGRTFELNYEVVPSATYPALADINAEYRYKFEETHTPTGDVYTTTIPAHTFKVYRDVPVSVTASSPANTGTFEFVYSVPSGIPQEDIVEVTVNENETTTLTATINDHPFNETPFTTKWYGPYTSENTLRPRRSGGFGYVAGVDRQWKLEDYNDNLTLAGSSSTLSVSSDINNTVRFYIVNVTNSAGDAVGSSAVCIKTQLRQFLETNDGGGLIEKSDYTTHDRWDTAIAVMTSSAGKLIVSGIQMMNGARKRFFQIFTRTGTGEWSSQQAIGPTEDSEVFPNGAASDFVLSANGNAVVYKERSRHRDFEITSNPLYYPESSSDVLTYAGSLLRLNEGIFRVKRDGKQDVILPPANEETYLILHQKMGDYNIPPNVAEDSNSRRIHKFNKFPLLRYKNFTPISADGNRVLLTYAGTYFNGNVHAAGFWVYDLDPSSDQTKLIGHWNLDFDCKPGMTSANWVTDGVVGGNGRYIRWPQDQPPAGTIKEDRAKSWSMMSGDGEYVATIFWTEVAQHNVGDGTPQGRVENRPPYNENKYVRHGLKIHRLGINNHFESSGAQQPTMSELQDLVLPTCYEFAPDRSSTGETVLTNKPFGVLDREDQPGSKYFKPLRFSGDGNYLFFCARYYRDMEIVGTPPNTYYRGKHRTVLRVWKKNSSGSWAFFSDTFFDQGDGELSSYQMAYVSHDGSKVLMSTVYGWRNDMSGRNQNYIVEQQSDGTYKQSPYDPWYHKVGANEKCSTVKPVGFSDDGNEFAAWVQSEQVGGDVDPKIKVMRLQ